jgi:heme exporter protein D
MIERMEKLRWTDSERNEEVLHTVNEERNILHTIKRRKASYIGHILRRNCLLKHVIEEKNRGKDISEGKTRKKT